MSKCYAVHIVVGGDSLVTEVIATHYEISDGFVSFYGANSQLIASFKCDAVNFVRIQVSESDDE